MSAARASHPLRVLTVLALTILAAACASTGPATRPALNAGAYRVGAPYEINGVRYVPHEQPDYDETGIASWYGPGFHGHMTADGEVYDQNGISAAHATLPLPVSVRVTNLDNGRSLVVRVNDRGPFHEGRIIDLSARAAELLGFKGAGTAHVRVQYLGPASQEPEMAVADASPPRPPRQSSHSGTPPLPPSTAPAAEIPVIAMAPIPNPAEASPAQMAPIPNPPEPQVAEENSTPPPSAESDTEPSTLNRAAQIAAAAASLLVSPAEAEPAPDAVKLRSTSDSPTRFYVQVGTFSQSANAEALYRDVAALGRAAIVPSSAGGKLLYRVRIGPIATREEAQGVMQDVIARGHPGAQVISE
jgi:rare lipoprotein A